LWAKDLNLELLMNSTFLNQCIKDNIVLKVMVYAISGGGGELSIFLMGKPLSEALLKTL
jgi:hypothetical protein